MKRKYKLLLIILISGIFTYLIYFFSKEDTIFIVALGDGISSGETAYGIEGISYNDYIKEYFDNKKLLKNFDDTYSYKNYKINELISDLKNNDLKENEELNIKQILHKANVITLCIGEEELVKLSITNDLNSEILKNVIASYDNLLFMIKEITDAKVIIIGFYENNYLDKSDSIILNSELSNIAIKYESIFINISDLMLNKEYFLDNNSYYFNYKGHKALAEMIIHSI